VHVVKASNGYKKKNRFRKRRSVESTHNRKQILPALMVFGGACGLMAGSASALELGDLTVDSALGQPLRASIAYALNPNEELYDFCVYLRPTLAPNGLPTVTKTSISVADGMILLTGSQAIREPLLTMQVSVDCPYTAHISREYTLMIDPPVPVVRERSIVVEPTPAVAAPVRAPTPESGEPQVRSRGHIDQSPIAERGRYLVQRGDTVSEIASRIADRSIPLWPAVDRIFAANPDAFMDGDVNRLKAGTWLDIPDLSVAAPFAEAPQVTAQETPAVGGPADTTDTGYDAAAATQPAEPAATTEQALATVDEDTIQEPGVPGSESGSIAELQPGDVVVGSGSPFVSPIGSDANDTESILIPDTEIVQPAYQPVPVVESDSENAGKTSGSWSWLFWLGGSGLALILGLLLFGQKFRQRFGPMAVGATSGLVPNRRRTDATSRAAQALTEVDFQVPDESADAESYTLDADFDDGSGLQDATDMDVAQDFGFSASSTFDEDLDLELPEGAGNEVEDTEPTDIIEPTEREEDPLVLDSEVLPVEDDDDYELSMIVDVTKQDVVESDATEKDLQAMHVDTVEQVEPDEDTMNRDTDYKILEQDYEDELTATQALNAEIEKAAAELADRMDLDATGEITAQLPENTRAQNDDAMTARLQSPDDAETVEMPANDDDIMANMEVESGKLDTKKKKKAS
jgi:hypothetical protein